MNKPVIINLTTDPDTELLGDRIAADLEALLKVHSSTGTIKSWGIDRAYNDFIIDTAAGDRITVAASRDGDIKVALIADGWNGEVVSLTSIERHQHNLVVCMVNALITLPFKHAS